MFARIKQLSINCQFIDLLDNILLEKFVFGLKQGKVKDRICEVTLTDKTSVSELVEIAVSKENDLLKAVDHDNINWVQNKQRSFTSRKGNKTYPESRYPNRLSGDSKSLFNEGNQQSSSSNIQQQFRARTEKGNQSCKICGKLHTGNTICKYKDYNFRLCNKVGHLQSVCRSSSNKNNFSRFFFNNETDSVSRESLIFNINSDSVEPINFNIKINNCLVKAQVDNGSGITVMSEKTFLLNFLNILNC